MVNGIARELEGEARVVRLDVTSRVGQQVAARVTVRALPTLIVVDGAGAIVLRQVGTVRAEPVLAAVRALSAGETGE